MIVLYENGFMKLPIHLEQEAFPGCFYSYLAGTRFEGRNLYPQTRYVPHWGDHSCNFSKSQHAVIDE